PGFGDAAPGGRHLWRLRQSQRLHQLYRDLADTGPADDPAGEPDQLWRQLCADRPVVGPGDADPEPQPRRHQPQLGVSPHLSRRLPRGHRVDPAQRDFDRRPKARRVLRRELRFPQPRGRVANALSCTAPWLLPEDPAPRGCAEMPLGARPLSVYKFAAPDHESALPMKWLLGLGFVLALAGACQAQETRIAAVVNNDIVTADDVNARLMLLLRSSGIPDTPQNRQQLLNRVLQ